MQHLGKITPTLKIILKREVQPELLEAVVIDYKPKVVNISTDEFTCLCPITNQPDFARIDILYEPAGFIVESKSLKLYLMSFRDVGIFHELVSYTISKDLETLLKVPVRVECSYKSRGGISINPVSL